MVNIELDYHSKIADLFQSHSSNLPVLSRGFALPKEVRKCDILFLGLNPSYSSSIDPEAPEHIFYDLKEDGNHPYFRQFEKIAGNIGKTWSHFDLLGIRETNQQKILELLQTREGLDFVWQHLNLAKEILGKADFKVLVVANTLARTFLGKDILESKNENEGFANVWLGYTYEFDKELGTDRISSKESALFGKPVFFTGMLTGQRALDKGSRERLIWQIARALNF